MVLVHTQKRFKLLSIYQLLKNIRKVKSFIMMVNQLSNFTEHLADKIKPLRHLLSKKILGLTQESAFKEIKECLISPPVLALNNVKWKTKLSSNTSNYSIGGVVLQGQDDRFWEPVAYFQERSQMWSHIIHQLRKKLSVLLGYVSVQVITLLGSP